MTSVFMVDQETGRCVLFDEAPGEGAFDNPNSSRNRPINSPESWLPYIYFHSDFNYLEVAFNPSISVSHSAVSPGALPPGSSTNFGWNSSVTDRLLFTHNLGYSPLTLCAIGNNMVWPGMPVQSTPDGGMRFTTIYSTTTEIRMKEFATVGSSTLPSINNSYNLLIFRNPPDSDGNILLDFNPDTGVIEMGKGKFKSNLKYLQVVPSGSPFITPYGGKSIDLQNGAMRAVRSDGTTFDPVPPGLSFALPRFGLTGTDFGYQYGSGMGYTGSYTGPSSLQVQAP